MKPINAARRAAAVAAAVTAALALAAPASAAPATVAPNCSSQSVSKPFGPFGDTADYFVVPGGSFERGSASWTLTGAASKVAAQEPWRVSARTDSTALSLPAGSSAASPVTCIGADTPTMRLFARHSGGRASGSALLVEAISEDLTGHVRRVPIGTVLGRSSTAWAPTPVLSLLASVAALAGRGPIHLRFSTLGAGTWQIDDAYVDPYHRCC